MLYYNTLNMEFQIQDIEAVSEHTPFHICSAVTEDMKQLVGLTIGSGWMRQVRTRLGGVKGCTHLIELLGPLATTAYQLLHGALEERAMSQPRRSRPGIIDTCHALASDGPVVKIEWPEFYTGKEERLEPGDEREGSESNP